MQGRRWAGKIVDRENLANGMVCLGSIYDARPTFESYSVEHGSAGNSVNTMDLFILLCSVLEDVCDGVILRGEKL